MSMKVAALELLLALLELPKLPGLGVEVNKELVIEENRTPYNWKNPVWRHADGSVAEW
jgi:galactonate dehydratase